ncbi:phosphatidate cytidylyltransferase [Flavobacterium sp.]
MNESLKRLLSGVVYVALLIIATSYSVTSFYILFGIFMMIAIYEFCQLVDLHKVFPLLFGAFAFCLATQVKSGRTNDILLLAATLFVSVKCLILLFGSKTRIDGLSKYIYVIGYVILPFILITKIPFGVKGFNPKIIISIFILIWTNDTFAYIVGKSIGKHKLIEKISPKKTIEGFIGGVIFSVIAGILISKFYIQPKVRHENLSLIIWTTSAVIISIFSTLGDLIESKFKRIAGVKDSGNIMPGHGGILDRLDSIIFVAPFVYLFYQILYYVS